MNEEEIYYSLEAGICEECCLVQLNLVASPEILYRNVFPFVDRGIDTGKILVPSAADISQKENIVAYPLLLLARGIPLLKNSI